MEFKLGDNQAMKKYQQSNVDKVNKFARTAAIEAYSRVSMATPVKTGRARYSWYCSISTIDRTVTPPGEYVLDPLRAAQSFANSKPGETLYIANNTPYIDALNKGRSNQAPARFVEMTVEQLQKEVDQLIRESYK